MKAIKRFFINLYKIIFCLTLGAFIAGIGGCASTTRTHSRKFSSISHTKQNQCRSTYMVNGKKYCVLKSARGFTQKGEASWYGPGFHGQKTASGKRYDQNKMTAAHKTLPFGTKIIVTNSHNKKSVKVKINDRGPFHGSRIIDLSRRAAKKIGIDGVAKVRIKAL